jgi:hypothetical protein
MFEPKILEKIIIWLVLIGFLAFCFGYIYAVTFLLGAYRLPFEFWILTISLALLFLSAFGLKIFRSAFIARKQS